MHTTVKISSDLNRAIMLRSFHRRNTPRSKASQAPTRSESDFGTKSYRDALQRSFNHAKQRIFFNPDMQYFVTLTYAGIQDDYTQVMTDLKILVKAEKRLGNNLKYIYVLEWQKRGSLHVHMITNAALTTRINKNNYPELVNWRHGYTSMLTIKDFDSNFRPHLYLFKYMKKAQRIGKSFVHSSKNLTNYTELNDSELNLIQWRTLTQEYTHATVNTTSFSYFKNYMQFDDTLSIQQLNNPKKDNIVLWTEQVKSNSITELQRLLENHSKHSN